MIGHTQGINQMIGYIAKELEHMNENEWKIRGELKETYII